MNLDESGIEALEQETPVPPPASTEEMPVLAAASPAATSTPAQVEERRPAARAATIEGAASPVTTKTRKPRARRVSECRDEERETVEPKEKPTKDKKEPGKVTVDKKEKQEEKKIVSFLSFSILQVIHHEAVI